MLLKKSLLRRSQNLFRGRVVLGSSRPSQPGPARLGSARLAAARHGQAWISLARLGPPRLCSARLGSAHHHPPIPSTHPTPRTPKQVPNRSSQAASPNCIFGRQFCKNTTFCRKLRRRKIMTISRKLRRRKIDLEGVSGAVWGRLCLVRLGSARFGLARPGSARIGSARLSPARPG